MNQKKPGQPEFTQSDLETLLDALYTYEAKDDDIPDKLEILVKTLPDICDDEENSNILRKIKCDLTSKESKLRKERKIRRERITMLKAKIIQAQQEYATDKLFNGGDDADEEKSDN